MFYIDCGVTSNISNNPSRGVAWWAGRRLSVSAGKNVFSRG